MSKSDAAVVTRWRAKRAWYAASEALWKRRHSYRDERCRVWSRRRHLAYRAWRHVVAHEPTGSKERTATYAVYEKASRLVAKWEKSRAEAAKALRHRRSEIAAANRVIARHKTPARSGNGSFGVDWAWGDASPDALRKANVKFACRYLSRDSAKNLTAAEAKILSDARIDLVVVWETTADRAKQGVAAGRLDAREALKQARACGMPEDAPIYFAVDFDGTAAQVAPYFRGVAGVLGKSRTGVYGGLRVVAGLFDAGIVDYGWQTYAWSGGKWDRRAQLQQYSNARTLAGVSCDYDRATADDFGQWRP